MVDRAADDRRRARPGPAGITMIGRRPDREPMAAIEVGLRRLRYLGLALLALAVVLPGGHRPDAVGIGLLLGLAIVAVIVDQAPRRLDRMNRRPDRIVAAQIGADVLITVGALIVIDPGPADGVWLIVAFPVIEGAIRYGVLGALTVWLTVTVPVVGWVIANWAPGDGLSTMTETGGLLSVALAVGLPAGSLAEHLVEELHRQEASRNELDEQAGLISVLAVAADDLSTDEPNDLCRTLVEAAAGLGFPGAELAVIDTTTMASQPLASEPLGFATATMTAPDVVRIGTTTPGTVHLGSAGELIGIVASTGTTMTVLAVGAEDGVRWRPRSEAFETLSRYGAAAMHATGQRLRVAEAARQLDGQRTTDRLTGLANRVGFEAAVTTVLDRLVPGTDIHVFAIDLHGSAPTAMAGEWTSGNEVLIEVGARLRRSAPPGAALARLDGGRFAIATDDRAAGNLPNHVRNVLGRPIATPQGSVVVRASIGHVVTPDPASPAAALIREAEIRASAAATV